MIRLVPRNFRLPFVLSCALLAAPVSSAPPGGHADFAAPLTWKKLAAGSSERFAFGSVFDPKLDGFIVYGGESNTKGQFGLPDDLWTYKTKENAGSQWRRRERRRRAARTT